MKKESHELLALEHKLAAVEKENERLKLMNEGLEIMINIAEKQFYISIPKKSPDPSNNGVEPPAPTGGDESTARAVWVWPTGVVRSSKTEGSTD